MEAVFRTVNITIEGVAVSPAFSSSARAFIASIPKGVAALPSPSRFAVMFMQMAWNALPFLSISRKSPPSIKEKPFASTSVSPDLSAMRISPPQKHIPPQRYMHSSTAFTGSVSTASVSCPDVPVKTDTAMETSISPAKIKVSISSLREKYMYHAGGLFKPQRQ